MNESRDLRVIQGANRHINKGEPGKYHEIFDGFASSDAQGFDGWQAKFKG